MAEKIGGSVEEIDIQISPEGKPYLMGNPVYFSISHSYPLVTCVICETPVGVDIEKIRPIAGNPERFCTKEECDYLNTAKNKEDYDERLITLWTKKEALFKINGTLPRKDQETDTMHLPNTVEIHTKRIGDFVLCIARKM